MLASHAALCASTGNPEMLVFHTLLAGNIGQFGAPGTTVVMAGGLGFARGDGGALDRAGDGLGSAASCALSPAVWPAPPCALVVDAQPARKTAARATATTRR